MAEARQPKLKEPDLSLHAQLEDVCAEFEAAWRRAIAGGPPPRVETFVQGVPDAIKEKAQAQLIEIERRFRTHAGDLGGAPSAAATEYDCMLGDTATNTPVSPQAADLGKTL